MNTALGPLFEYSGPNTGGPLREVGRDSPGSRNQRTTSRVFLLTGRARRCKQTGVTPCWSRQHVLPRWAGPATCAILSKDEHVCYCLDVIAGQRLPTIDANRNR